MPYVSRAQQRFFHSPGAKRAGISKQTVKEWDTASRGKKLKKRTPVVIDNKLKGSFGETHMVGGKPVAVKINVKKHKGNKAELADTIKHELMHVKHPKMTEKAVYKKVRQEKMSPAEQNKLISKLRTKKMNYKEGAVKRKMKLGAVKTAPGELISKAKSMTPTKRTAFMGMV